MNPIVGDGDGLPEGARIDW